MNKIFGFYLNGLTTGEILVGTKIYNVGTFLGEFVKNTRGGMFQNLVIETGDNFRVIGGKQIQRLFILGQKGFVSNTNLLPSNAFVKANDTLVQNIVAHIANPTDHIKIIGAVVDEKISTQIAILDTVNRLSNNSNLSSKFLLALLHSKLLNWYVYRFIFAKAIRTMHFDAPVSDRIPIRAINFADKTEKAAHDKMVALVEQMLEAKKHLQTARTDKDKNYYQDRCNSLDGQIDKLVYQLYDLTDEEIKIVEGKA